MKRIMALVAALVLVAACGKKSNKVGVAPKVPSKLLNNPSDQNSGMKPGLVRESLFSIALGGTAQAAVRRVVNPSMIKSQFVQYTDGAAVYELVDFGVEPAGETSLIASPFLTLDYRRLEDTDSWELLVDQPGRAIPVVAVGQFSMLAGNRFVITELCSGSYADQCSLVEQDGGAFGIKISAWGDPF